MDGGGFEVGAVGVGICVGEFVGADDGLFVGIDEGLFVGLDDAASVGIELDIQVYRNTSR